MALPFLIFAHASAQPELAGPSRYGAARDPLQRALSAGAALAIAGGIGSALVLALVAPKLVETGLGPIVTHNVPEVQRPDPVEPTVEPKREVRRNIITVPDSPLPPIGDNSIEVKIDNTPEFVPPTPDVGTAPIGGGIRLDPPAAPIFREATRDPRFARDFQPAYPAAREREGIEGRCPVMVTIAPSGRVTSVASNGCNDSAFFAATERQALRSWRFRPATRDGVAVESTQAIAVTFRMPE
jgi:periplasmic protein TonB